MKIETIMKKTITKDKQMKIQINIDKTDDKLEVKVSDFLL